MCLNPVWLTPYCDPDGKYSYRFESVSEKRSLIDPSTGELFESFQVGCGKCYECINLHKLQWTHRLLDELKCHEQSCFITLTYSPDDPFYDGNLYPHHVDKFLHDLRRKISPVRVRYYYCGEYGSNGFRPHYHMALFGYDFPDKVPFRRDRKGFYMSRSPMLESLWTHGFSSVLPCCENTFCYITKDMQKLVDKAFLGDNRPPFVRMSLKPGIGALGWNRSLTDGNLWHNGHSCPLPRYYKKLAEREGFDLSDVRRIQCLLSENRARFDDFSLKKYKSDKKLEKLLTFRS